MCNGGVAQGEEHRGGHTAQQLHGEEGICDPSKSQMPGKENNKQQTRNKKQQQTTKTGKKKTEIKDSTGGSLGEKVEFAPQYCQQAQQN